MTEEEAKGKWCPFSAVKGNNINCIAGKCMAWRIAQNSEQVRAAESIQQLNPNAMATYLNKGWVIKDGFILEPKINNPINGHCGLAGPV